MQSTSVSFMPQPRSCPRPPAGLAWATPDRLCGRSEARAPEDEALFRREGLLHDARNLMGTLGLYCDLLEMPGVLKPEHRHYAAEVRLVGAQSGDLLERLAALVYEGAGHDPGTERDRGSAKSPLTAGMQVGWPAAHEAEGQIKPVSLRAVVERCSGLLCRVAGGRKIEIAYGAASTVPVAVAEEAVQRILVNLVRNAAAALDPAATPGDLADGPNDAAAANAAANGGAERVGPQRLRERQDRASDVPCGAIRIGVGMLVNRVGDARPWPFRRVRLVVEDAGRGMSRERLARLLTGRTAQVRGGHGIGFRVVRDLVAASNGELSAMSAPGVGTRVQIEWPMAVPLASEAERSGCGLADDAAFAIRPYAAKFDRPRRAERAPAGSAQAAAARRTLRWPPGDLQPAPRLGRAAHGDHFRDLAGVPPLGEDLATTDPQPTRLHERMEAR